MNVPHGLELNHYSALSNQGQNIYINNVYLYPKFVDVPILSYGGI